MEDDAKSEEEGKKLKWTPPTLTKWDIGGGTLEGGPHSGEDAESYTGWYS